MSFSSEIKEELSKINTLANKELVKAELVGYLISSNTDIGEKKIKYATESDYNINRFSKLLNNVQVLNYEIDMQGKIFVITFSKKDIEELFKAKKEQLHITNVQEKQEDIKALIRGIFLGSGSMNNPENKYHLEMDFSSKDNAEFVSAKITNMGIKVKMLEGKNYYSLYIKEGEEISKFLAFIGANKAVLKFEEIRVKRDMNNKINRLVNCETANLNKTINAAVEQIEAIKYLQEVHSFEKLDTTLKEIALIRLENPNLPLSELGKFLKRPIGKSGVNYRLKKIIEIAEDLKK